MPTYQKNLISMRQDAEIVFNAAVKAVHGFTAVKTHCRRENHMLHINSTSFDLNHFKRIFVIGAGKASAYMGAALEELLPTEVADGLIIVKYGHTAPLKKIRLKAAGHPVPDENGCHGAREMVNLAKNAGKDDLILCVISGGGSALLPIPAPGLTLTDKQHTIRTLLACGASIHEINAIRKHLSLVKGGRLAEWAWPGTLMTLIISDVVGSSLDVIASGPTVADPTTYDDCMGVIEKYGIQDRIPQAVTAHIRNGQAGKNPETPKPGARIFEKTHQIIIADNATALAAAKTAAESLGYRSLILSSMIEGDTRAAAHLHGAIAKEIQITGNPLPAPACVLSGGETTVKIKGNGKGGRNQEFALTAAIDIRHEKNMVLLSAGTDGTDGPTDAAGAIVDTETIQNARAMGLNPEEFLENNDSYHFFKKTGDLLVTGPTGTNVMDLRVVMVQWG